jgi:hypothetical protein
LVGFIFRLSSCRGRKRAHVHNPVGDQTNHDLAIGGYAPGSRSELLGPTFDNTHLLDQQFADGFVPERPCEPGLPEHPYTTDVDTDSKPLTTKRSRFAAERVEFPVENS